MLPELAIAFSLNTTALEDFTPLETETQRIAREIFEDSYKERRPILKTRKVVIPIEERTDFVVRFRNKNFISVVYYFEI